MKESEAKTKWCPHARDNGCNVNIDTGGELPVFRAKCIGSDCMMWESYDYYLDDNRRYYAEQDMGSTRTNIIGGDCGLKSKDLECGI